MIWWVFPDISDEYLFEIVGIVITDVNIVLASPGYLDKEGNLMSSEV